MKTSYEAKNSCRIESRTGEAMGQFSAKLSRVFGKRLREYMKAGGGHFEHLLKLEKVFTLIRCLRCLECYQLRKFW